MCKLSNSKDKQTIASKVKIKNINHYFCGMKSQQTLLLLKTNFK